MIGGQDQETAPPLLEQGFELLLHQRGLPGYLAKGSCLVEQGFAKTQQVNPAIAAGTQHGIVLLQHRSRVMQVMDIQLRTVIAYDNYLFKALVKGTGKGLVQALSKSMALLLVGGDQEVRQACGCQQCQGMVVESLEDLLLAPRPQPGHQVFMASLFLCAAGE